MYLSDVLERLQTVKADLRVAYRIGDWKAIEGVMDQLTYITKDIEYNIRKEEDK